MGLKEVCMYILPKPIYVWVRSVHTCIYRWYIKHYYRNLHDINGNSCEPNRVHLDYWCGELNIGDQLAPVIFQYVTEKKGINSNIRTKEIKHLLTIGSLLDGNHADAVVWGSGVLGIEGLRRLAERKGYMKYDIRAVRGPISKEIMESMGYTCPAVYGDPGVLMALIYKPVIMKNKKYKISVIYSHNTPEKEKKEGYHIIDIRTTDYKQVIDEITASERIISEALHGMILAETYGTPAVFLRRRGAPGFPLKYYDWYYSTERYTVKTAATVEEAIMMEPMPLPELSKMREQLLKVFPADIFMQ